MVNTLGLIKSDCIMKRTQCIQRLHFCDSKVILCFPLATDDSLLHVECTNCSHQLVNSLATKSTNPQALQTKLCLLRELSLSRVLCHPLSSHTCFSTGSFVLVSGSQPWLHVGFTGELYKSQWLGATSRDTDSIDSENGLVSQTF